MSFQEFIQSIPHQFNDEEQTLLKRAYDFATTAHHSQQRASGEAYITHPISVAIILGRLFPDPTSIAAALLHDVPEDTSVALESINKKFGDKVAELVDGVTKLGKVRLGPTYQPQYLENLRKLFVATSRDVRVMLIKLADRLHNMQTIEYVLPEKQKRIALETLEVYAPIASRLGIGAWKDELEDRAFVVVDKDAHAKAKTILDEEAGARPYELVELENQLVTKLKETNISCQAVYGRWKQAYSLHKKLLKKNWDTSRCLDILALRVITNSIQDCYAALGVIHQQFQPMQVKDYIAMPKPNGYQSLHTIVLDKNGGALEIQIRTDLMHEQAERGVAAHWFYSESGKQSKQVGQDQSWANELRAWQDHEGNAEELLETLKLDLFQDRIFVLTPKGDVINLPKGAVAIDFAFSVHSDLGFHMTGAKINGRMESIYDELEQGDVVEILKSKNPVKISRDWIAAAKTAHARGRIKRYLAEKK